MNAGCWMMCMVGKYGREHGMKNRRSISVGEDRSDEV